MNSISSKLYCPSTTRPETGNEVAKYKHQTFTNAAGPMPHLNYYGGKILKKPSFVSLYFGKFWNSPQGASEVKYHDAFASKILQSRYTSVWQQYGVGKSSFLGSKTINSYDRHRTVDDATAQKAIKDAITAGNIPPGSGEQTVYTIYLPPNMTLKAPGGETSRDGVGGYHSSFDLPSGRRIYYAVLAYSDQNNGIDFNGNSRDNVSITASHEWSEAVTDPDVNNGRLGWYDRNYGEISDIPLSMGMPLRAIYERMDGFAVQKNWSNKDLRFEVEAAS